MTYAIKAGDRVTIKGSAPGCVYEVLHLGSNGLAALRREDDNQADMAKVDILEPLQKPKPRLYRNVYKENGMLHSGWHASREDADQYVGRTRIEVWELVEVLKP